MKITDVQLEKFIEPTSSGIRFNFKSDMLVDGKSAKDNSYLDIQFNQTLRIPDDGKEYPLPPGMGNFQLKHVEDYAKGLPDSWLKRGGMFLPMYQTEAMWFGFSTNGRPFAVKIAAGKINAVSGKEWDDEQGLKEEEKRTKTVQNYLSVPQQPWLDGFKSGDNKIKQFVAMPLDSGYTVEEQVTGIAEFGGFQIEVYPIKLEKWLEISMRQPKSRRFRASSASLESISPMSFSASSKSYDMGMAAGGSMSQSIEVNKYGPDCWDLDNKLRLYISVMDAEKFHLVTGEKPHQRKLTQQDYDQYRYSYQPTWFSYNHQSDTQTPEVLKNIKSMAEIAKEKGHFIENNESIKVHHVHNIGETFSSPIKKKP